MSSPLLDENSFIIFYGFSEKNLQIPLKEAMIRCFEKLGTVHAADDTKLTEKQKEEKYKVGNGMLHIVVTPIIEENGSVAPPKKYEVLPVLELSVELAGGVELLANKNRFSCPIWKKQKFVGSNISKKELVEKTVRSLEEILEDFILEYQQANPGKSPEFFLFA